MARPTTCSLDSRALLASDPAGRCSSSDATSEQGFHAAGARLTLGPMEDGELRELLAVLTPVPLRPNEVDRLVARAAGSPLVLDTLVRVGRERGGLDELPDSLESLIAAEIDVLSPFPRLLLGYAAGPRSQLQPAGVASVSSLRTASSSTTERSTALRDFVEFDPSGSARFRQAVVRDVSYRSLPYRRRRELHLRAGQVMEHLAAPAVDSVADLLSLHFFEGGDLRARVDATLETPARTPRRLMPTTTRPRCIGEPSTPRVGSTTSTPTTASPPGPRWATSSRRRACSKMRWRRTAGRQRSHDDDVTRAQILLKRARARERSGAFIVALRELTSAERTVDGHDGDDADARSRDRRDDAGQGALGAGAAATSARGCAPGGRRGNTPRSTFASSRMPM